MSLNLLYAPDHAVKITFSVGHGRMGHMTLQSLRHRQTHPPLRLANKSMHYTMLVEISVGELLSAVTVFDF